MNNPSYPASFYIKLENSQLLFINGPDSSKFLQGQVTCDIRELANPVTRIGAQCNPKGRILLSFRALQIDAETIALRMPVAMIEKAKASLGKYIVFSKAKLVTEPDHYQLFGLYGAAASEVAATWFGKLPIETDGWIEQNGSYLIQLADDRYECWITATDVENFAQAFTGIVDKGTENHWQLLDIQAGIANVVPETIELFTPQEINYQLVGGVNFRKGCYTGQEIVARLHYRGKLKRHMYRLAGDGALPVPGTALVSPGSDQVCGYVVMAAASDDNCFEILASLLTDHLNEAQLANRPEKLSPLTFPYAIPTAEEQHE